MADNEAYDGDGTSYSQLLFDVSLSDDYPSTTQTMLCFGKPNLDDVGIFSPHHQLTTPPPPPLPKSGIISSSASSNNNNNLISNIKREHIKDEGICATGDQQRSFKKNKSENVSSSSSSTGREKVRREKLGERVAVLQQLVSPYGKTDTASVLHEAMGYIRFLHEQVQVLCSPYLQTLLPNSPSPTTSSTIHNWRSGNGELDNKQEGKGGVLRSKGLCLIPVDCTLPLANQNGADLWTPAMVGTNNNNNNNDQRLLFNH